MQSQNLKKETKYLWKNFLSPISQACLVGSLMLLLLIASLGCQSLVKEKAQVTYWENNFPLPKDVCDLLASKGKDGFYGFHRKLKSEKYELISVCTHNDFVAIPVETFHEMVK